MSEINVQLVDNWREVFEVEHKEKGWCTLYEKDKLLLESMDTIPCAGYDEDGDAMLQVKINSNTTDITYIYSACVKES